MENERFRVGSFSEAGHTLSPPRAGAPVASRSGACYQGVERALSQKHHSASLRLDQVPPKDIADKSMVR